MASAAEMTRSGVDAWVCSSEMAARSLYVHLEKAGLKIPKDVGVTGFHCSSIASLGNSVTFTSTEAPSAELGAAALRRLVHRIEGIDNTRRIILLPCSLRLGNTTREAR